MNTVDLSSWLFLHPDFDDGEGTAGLQTSVQGSVEMVMGLDAVRQSVLMLLTTRPGERVMRPQYGCDLSGLVFAPNDATTAGLAIFYVREALLRWEPRIEILHLDARPNDEASERLDIVLEYRVRSLGRDDQIIYSVDLSV